MEGCDDVFVFECYLLSLSISPPPPGPIMLHRQTGFTSFTLLAKLSEPGAIYAYAVTQALKSNVTLNTGGWPPAVDVSTAYHSAALRSSGQ